MSDRDDFELLLDIEEAIGRISTYTREMTYEQFLADTKTQDAVIRNRKLLEKRRRSYQ